MWGRCETYLADGERMQAVICVLIKNFKFEFKDGPDTKFEIKRAILPRPRIAGAGGTKLPLKVRRVE